ncbi:uridine 5'-monophosphate synthase isoform X2 [Nematostella vectensis]|uniref:uridine 5'-monophosphate synthase isoform X2 n=1 Tax=Nematostella vectensis TaxID=45351 RepID=UPI00207726D7|nr:uridine 5'-monophosphate synthase isoform X2 [Nematostella vectensis]
MFKMAGENDEALIAQLFEINAFKFGKFTLKSGIDSPVYIDLRVIVSYPDVLQSVSKLMWNVVSDAGLKFDVICGVPYTALPIASCMSVNNNAPMVMRRKEAKSYGTKKLIEGHFEEGSTCLVIEDIVTSGSSVLETVESLTSVKLQVTDTVVLLDRCQGGKDKLDCAGIRLHSLFTLPRVLKVLHAQGKVDDAVVESVREFLEANQFKATSDVTPVPPKGRDLSFLKRLEMSSNPVAKKVFKIMHSKETNLAVSVDLTKSGNILNLVNQVGPHVCIVKTHVDIIEDFTPGFVASLQNLATKHNFLIFEDRKFADIGNTVKHQYSKGIYHISDWAHITNAHPVPGEGVITGLKEIGAPKGNGCLIIAEMSAKGNFANGEYTKAAIEMAKNHQDFVFGFISIGSIVDDPGFVHMTPGVKLIKGGDALGQQYLTPEEVVGKKGSDVIIVGRGIYEAENPASAAIEYKEAAYKAYLQRITNTGLGNHVSMCCSRCK